MPYINEYSELTSQEQRQLRYKRKYKEEFPEWDDSMIKLTHLVREQIVAPASVLDFGCGRGNFVIDELSTIFAKKIGYDVAFESTVGNVTNQKIVIGDGNVLPFADASFDAVLSLWVFEHVAQPDVVFTEIHRVLTAGGIFAFVTPNKNSFLITLRRLMSDNVAYRLLKWVYGRQEKDAFEVYYRVNTIKNIHQLARLMGFKVEVATTNADPSYTSFGPITYWLSKIFTQIFGTYAHPHVIVLLRK